MKSAKKRFSIKLRMQIVFGTLIIVALSLLSVFVLYQFQKAVIEKVSDHLVDKVNDTAVILDSEIEQWFEYLDGIASQYILHNKNVSYAEKNILLKDLTNEDERITSVVIIDPKGVYHRPDGQDFDVSGQKWFKESNGGRKRYFTEPFRDIQTGKLITQAVVPIIAKDNSFVGTLGAVFDGYTLSEAVDNIKVGKSGGCFIISGTGLNIANRNRSLVENEFSAIEAAKTDRDLAGVAQLSKKCLKAIKPQFTTTRLWA